MDVLLNDPGHKSGVYLFVFTVCLSALIGLLLVLGAAPPAFAAAIKWLLSGLFCLTLFVLTVINLLIRCSFLKHRSFLQEYRVLEKRISPVNLNSRFVFEQKMKFLEIITIWKKTGETFDRAAAVLWQKEFKARFYKLEYFVPHY